MEISKCKLKPNYNTESFKLERQAVWTISASGSKNLKININ